MGIDARVFAAVNEHDHIEWSSGVRWFSITYPRGHWPTIRNQITTLQERFPEYHVYYMSDNEPWNERGESFIATPERIADFDRQWAEYEALRGEQ